MTCLVLYRSLVKFVDLPSMVPRGYVVCNDENEPILFGCFFAAQNASANLDVFCRKLDATAPIAIVESVGP